MDVRVDEITGVRFVRGPYPLPSFPGPEVLTVEFLGSGGANGLACFVHDLYDGRQQMRPEKLQAWQVLRERYGNRDESRVDQGRLLPAAAWTIKTTSRRERTVPGPACQRLRSPSTTVL
jgi:hypothetical protein